MTIIEQVAGTGLTDLAVNEETFTTRTGRSIELFQYDGADWKCITNGDNTTVTLADYGVSFVGTPVLGDELAVACQVLAVHMFYAGQGINAIKLNENFASLGEDLNTNENEIQDIADTALLKDGSNLTQTIINEFQAQEPNIITGSGTIALTDNTANFLTLTGNATISLPTITQDAYSHTIVVTVEGSNYTLDVATATNNKHLYIDIDLDPTQTYCVLFLYNKIEDAWYYSLNQ